MQRYAWATAAIVVALVLAFAAVEAAGVGVLSDPRAAMSDGGAFAAVVGVGLLVGDVVLPVPSSLVMLAHGALFGVGLGTLLSLLGTVGAAVAGVWIGRRSERLLGVPAGERRRAQDLVDRWGAVAVVATRPVVPVLAEAVVIMAGAAGASALQVAVAAAAGGCRRRCSTPWPVPRGRRRQWRSGVPRRGGPGCGVLAGLDPAAQRPRAAADVMDEIRLEVVASGFDFPTSAVVDDHGVVHVVESGLAFGGSRAGGTVCGSASTASGSWSSRGCARR